MSADVAGRGRIPGERPESNGLVGPMWPHAGRRWLPTPTTAALVLGADQIRRCSSWDGKPSAGSCYRISRPRKGRASSSEADERRVSASAWNGETRSAPAPRPAAPRRAPQSSRHRCPQTRTRPDIETQGNSGLLKVARNSGLRNLRLDRTKGVPSNRRLRRAGR